MSIFHNKTAQQNIIVTEQEKKQPDMIAGQKKNAFGERSGSGKAQNPLHKNKPAVQEIWDERFYHENDEIYRIIGNKSIYSVGDNEAAWEKHAKEPVEYGFPAELLENISEKDLAKMWKGKAGNQPEGYIPGTGDLSGIRQSYLLETLSPQDVRMYADSMFEGEYTGETFKILKEKGLWDIFYLLDLTREYHAYKQHKDQYRIKEMENCELRKKVMQTSKLPSKDYSYEKQVSCNCYGCAGSKIINHLTKTNLLNQYKVRNFVPRYLSRTEFLAGGEDFGYDQSKRDINQFAGMGKGDFGNFFAISDVVFDKKNGGLGRRDIALHKCTFGINKGVKPNLNANMIEAMKSKIHKVLKTGEPVAFFSKGHYVTIVGLSDDKISYLDSMSLKPEIPITEEVNSFLYNFSGQKGLSSVELTWATKITKESYQELKNEYDGLAVNEQTGEAISLNPRQEFEDVAHRAGIAIRKTNAKIEEEGNEDIAHYMTESICLHRGSFMSDQQFAQWEIRDNEAWTLAQAEEQQEAINTAEKKKRYEQEKALKRQEQLENEQQKITEDKAQKEKPVKEQPDKEKAVKEQPVNKQEVKYTDPQEHLKELKQQNTVKQNERLSRIKKMRINLYGDPGSGILTAKDHSFMSALRCMQMFDPGLTDEELATRFVQMGRVEGKGTVIRQIERSKKACLMEDLIGKILSFDIRKELTAKDPAGMTELYFKFEPLFAFASDRKQFMDTLGRMQGRKDTPLSLSAEDIKNINEYLQEIDRYGEYYASFIEQDERTLKSKAPDPEQKLISADMRAKLSDTISKKWSGFDENASPVLQYVRHTDSYSTRDGVFDDRMKIALRDQAIAYDKALGITVMKAASVYGYDDAQSADLYRSLKFEGKKTDIKKLDERSREAYINAAEKVFGAVLSFDAKSLSKEGIGALMADEKAFRTLNDIAGITLEVMKMTENYRNIDSDKKALGAEQLAAVEKLCTLAYDIRTNLDEQMVKAADKEFISEKDKNESLKASEAAYVRFLEEMGKISAEDIQAALKAIENKDKQAEQTRRKTAGDKLNDRINAGLAEFAPGLVSSKFFDGYAGYSERKAYTQTRREKEMKTKGTDLFIKNSLADQMINSANRTKDRIARARRMISFNVRKGITDAQFKALSAFFSGNISDDSRLVRGMGTETIYRELTTGFLSMSAAGLDLSDDRSLSKNAERLEDISLKVQAMKTLMDLDPAFVKMLMDQTISSSDGKEAESLYDRVMLQMDRMGRLSDHYRIRKLVMTDSYYLSHYNDEIGLKVGKGSNSEQERLSRLLIKCKDTADILNKLKTGKSKPDQWMTSGRTETIAALEAEHRMRPFAANRLDLNLVSKESVKSLALEIKDFMAKHPGMDIKLEPDRAKTFAKGYSKLFQDMILQIIECSEPANCERYLKNLMPGVHERLKSLAKTRSDHNRLNGYNSKMRFEDPGTGEFFEYGSDMNRDMFYLIQAGYGQMSEEEILEMFEGFSASKWKDIDFTDPVQVAAAKDMYLRSHARIYQIFTDEQTRQVNTHGMIPMQLPPLAYIVAMNGNLDLVHRTALGNAVLDMMSHHSAKFLDGQKQSMLDYMVAKGYLSGEYVENRKNISDHQSGYTALTGNIFPQVKGFMMDDAGSEDYNLDPVLSDTNADQINAHRGHHNGPEMRADEENKIWIDCSSAIAEAGMAEQGKLQFESNMRAIRTGEQYTRSMATLKRYINNLTAVDTSGHSKEYKYFDSCLKKLMECYSGIAKKCPADGKNLDPESMIDLRRAYDKAIRAATAYLRPKNREHRNAIYRRRYDIVDELITTMEKDYRLLGEKSPDKSYSLEEALEESRAVVVDITGKKLKEVGARLSKRKLIPQKIDGVMRNWVFTERNAVGDDEMYKKYGISPGSNLDMRNVAMSIMAKELGTQDNIAHSEISKLTIQERGRDKKLNGTIMEYIEGLSIDEVKRGLLFGDIIADNEPELVKQLADIQVTDYLCGNVDRHMNNILFVMEDTGQRKKNTRRAIRRIRRIVGIDNDLSFGKLLASNIKRQTNKMSIPETMQLISRSVADRVLALEKDKLFLTLGATVTQAEKEAMWTRVEHLQIAIMNASAEETHGGLSIVDSFDNYKLSDLAGANLERGNIYNMFYRGTDNLGQKNKSVNADMVPHRLNAEEVRMDIRADKNKEDASGDTSATMCAIILYLGDMKMSASKLRKMNTNKKKQYLENLYYASGEFNNTVGRFFDKVSTLGDYGKDMMPVNERMNLFSNEYARNHGVDSILDIIFIDGRPASEVLPPVDDIVKGLEADPVILKSMIGGLDKSKGGSKPATAENRLAFRDMVAKAYIMAHIVSGKKQVTVANYQKNAKGEDELVITDLNAYVHGEELRPLIKGKFAGYNDNAKLINTSRKNRKERFTAIRKQIEARRKKIKE